MLCVYRVNMLFHLSVAKSAGTFMNLCEAVGNGAQAMKLVVRPFSYLLKKVLGRSSTALYKTSCKTS